MHDYQFMGGGIIVLFIAAFLLFASSDGYLDRSYLYAWSLLPLVATYWIIELAPGHFSPFFKFLLGIPFVLSILSCAYLLWEDIEKKRK